jgi:hypothetical protein
MDREALTLTSTESSEGEASAIPKGEARHGRSRGEPAAAISGQRTHELTPGSRILFRAHAQNSRATSSKGSPQRRRAHRLDSEGRAARLSKALHRVPWPSLARWKERFWQNSSGSVLSREQSSFSTYPLLASAFRSAKELELAITTRARDIRSCRVGPGAPTCAPLRSVSAPGPEPRPLRQLKRPLRRLRHLPGQRFGGCHRTLFGKLRPRGLCEAWKGRCRASFGTSLLPALLAVAIPWRDVAREFARWSSEEDPGLLA